MDLLSPIIVIFTLIVIGYIVRRIGIVTEAMNKELSRFVMNVSLPAFLLSSMDFEFSVEILKDSGYLVLISFAVYAFSIVLSKIYSNVMGNSGGRRAVIEYVIVFSNCGYMGYPVVSQIFGEKAVFYAAIYNLAFNILIWTYGVSLLRVDKSKGSVNTATKIKHLINPGIVAIVIGYALFLLNISLPPTIKSILTTIGSTTTPLSMMFIGFILTEVHLQSALKDIQLWLTSAIRLIIIPLVVYSILSLLGFTGLMLIIPVVISAMPVAVNTAIFASEYGADYRLGSLLIFSSTLLSVVTIPFLILFLK